MNIVTQLILWMFPQLHSLQSMIKERQSTASKELSARHVTEYTALVTLMKSRFGDNLLVPEEDEFDDIDTGVSAAAGTRSRNNNAEDMRHGCGNSGIYQTIELEVREGNYRASRQREEEVHALQCVWLCCCCTTRCIVLCTSYVRSLCMHGKIINGTNCEQYFASIIIYCR